MNAHEKISELLVEFALQELSEEQSSEVTKHLAECQQCREELKGLETVLGCAESMSQLSADGRSCKSAKEAVFKKLGNEEKIIQIPGPYNRLEIIWRTIMRSPITKLAAAAVITIVIMGGLTFLPKGDSDNERWWLGPPVAWSKEIDAALETIKGVTCSEQTIMVEADGSKHESSTWDKLYVSHDSYRRDIYDGDFLREIQWYIPDGNDMIQTGVRFDLKCYSSVRHKGSFRVDDPVERMRFYVRLLDKTDRRLGQKVIEDRDCVGFEISAGKYGDNPEQWTNCIWFDVETKLPVRIEKHGRPVTDHPDKTFTTIQDQFDYNPELPADTFIPRIPEGFTHGHPDDIRATREKESD